MLFFKRLELHGFKSFANKTTIDLFPGVTVVVGPNGCGKSNIFDSIRWVLGEQSAKSMRGARMGDVIFNGSGGVKATGMARVNLVLNNAMRVLPTDFDEVSIQRRLFRTGESEYLMNKANCRLKDITNLFMDTGVGTDSYSVMEQGKVDAVINSKPLERRAIFDEAAGIAKYKARKEEALRKLDRTDADLTRLADIIAEVRRQANSLKRQAAKANRYKKLSTELRVLEMELLVRRFFMLKEATSSTETRYQELSARVTELRGELAVLDEQQAAGRVAADEVQAALEVSQSLQFEVNSSLSGAQNRIALLEQRISDHGDRISSLAGEINQLDDQMRGLDEEIAKSELEIGAHSASLDSLREDFSKKKAHFDTLKSDSDQSLSSLANLRQEINSLTRSRFEAENESRTAHAMEGKLADEMARGEAELALLNQQIEAMSVEKDEKQSVAEEAEQLLAALKSDLESTIALLRTCEGNYRTSLTELEQARRESQTCQSRHDALAELQENFEGYYRGVRDVMLASKSGQLHGIVGVVSSLIEAKGEHELAIEAALGSQAQDIIAETAEDGKAAIRMLKQSNTGRATLLPLDLIQPRRNDERNRWALAERGVVGFATDLVKHEARITPAVEYLLGNVLVCENLDVAVELLRRGVKTRFVTLGGDVLNAHGAMSGGSVKAAGLLHRTREVKELAQQLEGLRGRLAGLETSVVNLRAERESLRERHDKLMKSANAQEIENARARSDFQVVDQKLSDKLGQRTSVLERNSTSEAEIAGYRQKQETAGVRIEELSRQLVDLEARLADAEAHSTGRQQEVADFAREINELMITISTNTERLSSMRDRLASAQREKVRVAGVQTDKQGEIANLRSQQDEAAAEIETLRKTVEELQGRIAEIAQQITHETEKREVVQLDLRKLGERAHVLQRDFNEAQNEHHEVELKRTEDLVQLRNVEIQAQEKFSLTLEEVITRVFSGEAVAAADLSEDENTEEAALETVSTEEAAETVTEAPAGYEFTGNFEEALARLREPEVIGQRIADLRTAIDRMGPVHVGAIDEYNELNARYEFLTTQERDLVVAKTQLTETIQQIDETSKDLFAKAFTEIRDNFVQMFRRLFGGGKADLLLTEENGVLDSGIDIVAQPPGKKPQHISLLSGGEKALTAVALLFAIFMRKPSPFCILDEIDAPLDDKNIERFKELVRDFAHTTQFIIITHNKQTMALANTIYGITMEEPGVSKVVSIRLDEFDQSEFARETALAG
ncbi:MAG: chromosome segregation protein SMC [Candidatus Sumerlaeaceae bacterium]|nr:chromosome segregation protein SMC [Candidatus Sumerlaeaceae bacterium]